jgi:hypothetical protein
LRPENVPVVELRGVDRAQAGRVGEDDVALDATVVAEESDEARDDEHVEAFWLDADVASHLGVEGGTPSPR